MRESCFSVPFSMIQWKRGSSLPHILDPGGLRNAQTYTGVTPVSLLHPGRRPVPVGHDGGPGAVPAGAGPAGAGRHGAVHPGDVPAAVRQRAVRPGGGSVPALAHRAAVGLPPAGPRLSGRAAAGDGPLCAAVPVPQLQPGGGRPCAGRAPAAPVADRGVLSLHVPHQHGGGDRVPGRHLPDPAGTLRPQPGRRLESLPAFGAAVRRRASDQPAGPASRWGC